MDKLNSYRKLGEKILKTSELCRKLETEKVRKILVRFKIPIGKSPSIL